jgi:hypothetical protein
MLTNLLVNGLLSHQVREACIDAMGKIASISQDLMERALSGVWKSMDSDDR